MPSPLFGPTQAAATYAALGNSDTPIMGMTEQQLLQQILVAVANLSTGGGGGGTVTSFSAVGQDGVGVNVTNPTTTPELTISLGNITPDRVTVSIAGAVSTSEIGVTGTWYSGGNATTTKPKVLIEVAGATSNNWSTDGTGLGINAAAGFTGNLLEMQVNGTSKFTIDSTGSIWDKDNQVMYFKTADGTQAVRFPYNDNKALTGLVALDAVAGRFRADANGMYVSLGRYVGFTDSEQEGTVDTRITRAAPNKLGISTAATADAAVASTHSARMFFDGVEYKVLLATP